jgi:glycerol-3-phosphate acyltransferase PlsX
MGGDHAPHEIVAGAVQAVRERGLAVVLVGSPRVLYEALADHDATKEIPIVRAEEALAMDEGALASLRRPRSSIAIACHLVRRGDASAVVSAGSTAGIVTTGRLRLKAQQGVLRPAIAVALPTLPTPTLLIDAGANAEVKPEMLVQFGHLGAAYAELAYGIDRPKVGLLTIGSEAEKGDKIVRRAHELMQGSPGLRFIGNIEGHDLLSGVADVITTDGFTGNVALKTMEGAVRYAFGELRQSIGGSRLARLGALLQRPHLRELRRRLDPEAHGGAVLLGLNGTVVIAHGSSRAAGIGAACKLAADLSAAGIVTKIGDRIAATHRPHRLRTP